MVGGGKQRIFKIHVYILVQIIHFHFWAQIPYKFTSIREKVLNERIHIQNSPYTYINVQQLGKYCVYICVYI